MLAEIAQVHRIREDGHKPFAQVRSPRVGPGDGLRHDHGAVGELVAI